MHTSTTRSTPSLLRCRERLRARWERLHIDVRCALRVDEPRRIRQYLEAGTKLAGLGAADALPVQMRMLRTLLRAAQDDALPHFWRSACLEHIAVPLERLRGRVGPHDPLALQAIETAARATALASPFSMHICPAMTHDPQAPHGPDSGETAAHGDPAPRWKQLTLVGNARFEQGDFAGALSSHAQARGWALEHFTQWPDADDAVAAVVVSHLNLSEAQARLGLVDEAAQTLERAHAGLLHIAGDNELGPALRGAAVRHLRETYAALLRFQGVYGERPELMRWLQRGCACAAHGEPCAEPAPGLLH